MVPLGCRGGSFGCNSAGSSLALMVGSSARPWIVFSVVFLLREKLTTSFPVVVVDWIVSFVYLGCGLCYTTLLGCHTDLRGWVAA